MANLKISTAPISVKLFITLFLVITGLGYAMAMLNVHQSTGGMSIEHIVKHYRGSEEELIYPTEFNELVGHAHIHLFTISWIFFFMVGIFLLTSFSEKLKTVLAVVPFLLIISDIGSMWLIRYVAPGFVWLLVISGMTLGVCFLILFIFCLYDIWVRKEA